ncbi:MAG: hypothetical protein QM791_04275 [Ferruginibacter sp.]
MKSIVDLNTALQVGQTYNVRCAKMVNKSGSNFYYMPVIGEIHNDNQFGFPDKHVHIDGRFVGIKEMVLLPIDEEGKTNTVCSFRPCASEYVVSEIVIRRRKCKRLTTGIKPPDRFRKNWMGETVKQAERYWAWYDSMIGKSCKGRRCPHLGTTMHEDNGVLICPLHNLHGCIKTEIIIKETTDELSAII